MSTDASYRFERWVDPATMETAVLRAAELVLATAGGELGGEVIDACAAPWEPPVVSLRPSRVRHLLGVEFPSAEIVALLAPLGYREARTRTDAVDFVVPGHRSYDTLREVDLIEEVARTHGYDTFPSELSPFRSGTVPDDAMF